MIGIYNLDSGPRTRPISANPGPNRTSAAPIAGRATTHRRKPVKIKAVWDKITPSSCRWYQTMSRDGGKTWEYGTYMDWTRVR